MAQSTTKVSVQIGAGPNNEFRDIPEYSIDSSVLTLCDTFELKIADPSGERTLNIKKGDPVSIFMTDPAVSGGQKVQMMKGLVVDLDFVSDDKSGTTLSIMGADLGWHLVNTCGTLFQKTMNTTFAKFLERILVQAWGFSGVVTDNDFNRKIQQGLKLDQRRAAVAAARAPENVFIPPVCFEVGEMIADKLITYARRAQHLVNVSADGYLQLFKPTYTVEGYTLHTLHFHKPTESQRKLNNVLGPVRVHESIESVNSDVTCVWTVLLPTAMSLPTRFNPHAGQFRETYSDHSVLPWPRLLSFGDGDTMSEKMGKDRAKWKFQRGLFDAWVANYTAFGHVGNGTFFTPDTMIAVDDTVSKRVPRGNYYLVSRRFVRRPSDPGTVTYLQLRKPNLLGA